MANKVYTATEQSLYFQSGSGDGAGGYINGAYVVGFSPMGLLAGSGRISHPRDFGAGSRSSLFRWSARTRFDGNVTLGKCVELYWAGWDRAVDVPGNFASGDYMFSEADKKFNCQYLGSITATAVASGTNLIQNGKAVISERYGSLIWVDRAESPLTGASGDHRFVLTPEPDEIQ
jgi:hypothetical protein